ncbi:MAG: glycosyltransferase [Bacteroidales bacterium]|nr:glycosyltransferase [Bacteroidales bacterium]
MKSFTLVSTIFNEGKRLEESLNEIENQSVKPDEIVIVDAGSSDGSLDILNKYSKISKLNFKIIVEKGCNVARGRNIAIKNASNNLIVSTDFGCKYNNKWLETLVKYFDDETIEVVGGGFSINESEVKTRAQIADYILQNGYKLKIDDNFSVSSRSIAYYKYVWEKIGGYHEWLTLAADDTIFWREIKKANFKFIIAPQPLVFWNRHQNYKQFAKEAGRYGLGDGESKINFRNFLSNFVETIIRYSIIPFIILFIFLPTNLKLYFAPIFVIQLFGLRSYFRAIKYSKNLNNKKYGFKNLPMCFFMIETQRLAYIKNYIKGWFFKSNVQKQAQKKLDIK